MCAALMIPLESGYYVPITDDEETLTWDRSEHAGWWAGLYADPDVHLEADRAIRHAQTPDGGVAALVPLVDQVMRSGSS